MTKFRANTHGCFRAWFIALLALVTLMGPSAAQETDHAAASAQELAQLVEAAEGGSARAQYKLGAIYGQGDGVPQDYAEAVKWYRRAAEQGIAGAQNNLGAMYAKGQGVPQNYVQAHKWFNLAAARGHEEARNYRDLVAERMTREQIQEAQRLAAAFEPKPESPKD